MYFYFTEASFLLDYNNIASSSCLQIARAFGASEIIAVDVQDDKLQKAKTLGATHTINSLNEDAVEKIRVRGPFLDLLIA